MASGLVVAVLAGLLFLSAGFAAPAEAPQPCVRDARAALDAQWLAAFGPEATVEGPKTVEEIEQEALFRIAECTHCPLRPFGYQYAEWEQFKRLVRPGDCVVFFRSNPASWEGHFGREGYALVRGGRIVRWLLTALS